jgi:acetyl esterase/lipase
MRRVPLRWLVLSAAVLSACLLGVGQAAKHVRAAELLGRLAGGGAEPSTPLLTEEVTFAGKDGPIRGRLYFRTWAERDPGIVVAHGVHYRGIDERRLVPFVRALCESGLTVLTPELKDLADYRITESGVAVIQDSVRYLASRSDRVSGEGVALLGFSFAGGLSLVAAEEPGTARLLESVTSVGGHHDLRRVLRFLVHDEIETPDGVVRSKAHDYGLVVLVYGNLERFVPEEDLAVMREAFRAWLHEDQRAARSAARQSRTPESARLWKLLEQQRLQTLAPELDRLLEQQRPALRRLSARGRLRSLSVPVYLLHGSHDSVIPPSETDAASLELAGTPHRALISPLLEHVDVSERATLGDKLALVSFLANLL